MADLYAHQIASSPESIGRKNFIHKVFEIGWIHYHNLDTILSAVIIGDWFVRSRRKRPICTWCGTDPEFMGKLVEPIFSYELAYVASMISSKRFEDTPLLYPSILEAVPNAIVHKFEWEILLLIKFSVRTHILARCLRFLLPAEACPGNEFGSNIYMWLLNICRHIRFTKCSPLAVILGTVLLVRRGRLKSNRFVRQARFKLLLQMIADNCETTVDIATRTYIESRTKEPITRPNTPVTVNCRY